MFGIPLHRNNAGRQWYCLHTTELTEYISNVANLGAYTCSSANIIIITYNYSCSYSYVPVVPRKAVAEVSKIGNL